MKQNKQTTHLIVARVVKNLHLPERLKGFLLKGFASTCKQADEQQMRVTRLFQETAQLLRK